VKNRRYWIVCSRTFLKSKYTVYIVWKTEEVSGTKISKTLIENIC
jgi:hypothetical protein